MAFVRLFFVLVVIGALCALGYAFWLTFEPLDAPPKDEQPATGTVMTAAPARSAAEAPGTPPPRATRPSAAAASRPALDDRPHPDPVLDHLREPIRTARGAVQGARAAANEARRVSRDIRDALPDTDDVTLENAWQTAKEAGVGLVEVIGPDGDVQLIDPRGRIHPSGAPPHNGGGAPRTARQPGIDWYRAGGSNN